MGWRFWVVIPCGVFSVATLIFLFIWGYSDKQDRAYVQSTCTVTNYTFVAPSESESCSTSWINVVSAKGANLIYLYTPNVCDTVQKYHVYASQYPIGFSSTCFLSANGWTWQLSGTQVWFWSMICYASIAGAFMLAWLITETTCKLLQRKRKVADVQLQDVSQNSNDLA